MEESWDFKGDDEFVRLQMQFVRGPLTISKVDIKVYSSARPDFYRIYRYDQGADILRGVGAPSDRVKSISFKATGGKLASLFDGSEHVVSITSLPYYSRQVFLP
jgi:hypothetical protein